MSDTMWISTEERLPDKTGNYLTITENNTPIVLSYSAKLKMFCANDWQSLVEARKTCIKCKYWMGIPDIPRKEMT